MKCNNNVNRAIVSPLLIVYGRERKKKGRNTELYSEMYISSNINILLLLWMLLRCNAVLMDTYGRPPTRYRKKKAQTLRVSFLFLILLSFSLQLTGRVFWSIIILHLKNNIIITYRIWAGKKKKMDKNIIYKYKIAIITIKLLRR